MNQRERIKRYRAMHDLEQIEATLLRHLRSSVRHAACYTIAAVACFIGGWNAFALAFGFGLLLSVAQLVGGSLSYRRIWRRWPWQA